MSACVLASPFVILAAPKTRERASQGERHAAWPAAPAALARRARSPSAKVVYPASPKSLSRGMPPPPAQRSGRGRRLGVGRAAKQIQGDCRCGKKKPVDGEKMAALPSSANGIRGARYFRPLLAPLRRPPPDEQRRPPPVLKPQQLPSRRHSTPSLESACERQERRPSRLGAHANATANCSFAMPRVDGGAV